MDTKPLTSTSEPLVSAGLTILPKGDEVEEGSILEDIPEDIMRQIRLEARKNRKWYDFVKSVIGAAAAIGAVFLTLAVILSLIDTQKGDVEFHWQGTVAILIYIGLAVILVGVVADEIEWRRWKKKEAHLIGNYRVL